MAFTPLWAQLINLLAALLLLLAFAMLAQRRVLTLIDLFAAQGFALACSTAIVAYATHQSHLYWSAGLTLTLKVVLLPWLLLRMIRKLDVLVGVLILGVFFFQIREQFDSLDLKHLEKLKESEWDRE